MWRFLSRPIVLALSPLLLSGCVTLDYYYQAVRGQAEILAARRPVAQVVADETTTPQLRQKLLLVEKLKTFAATELRLPVGDVYSHYVDTGKRFVIWNVFATPELSLKPKMWAIPLVGEVAYHGYFNRADAQVYVAELAQEGYDTFVGGVAAYSTLGWFDDPLLNTFLNRSDDALAELLFHELAHRRLYVSGDTTFNESFATTVGREGLKRWLTAEGKEERFAAFVERRRKQEAGIALMVETRKRLAILYDDRSRSDAEKRAGKKKAFERLRADYNAMRVAGEGGSAWLDGYIGEGMNNARLNAVGAYNDMVPRFRKLLERLGGDLEKFYAAVEQLAE